MAIPIAVGLMGAGILGAVGLGVVLMVRRSRRDREARRGLAETLGFQPLEPVPEVVSGQIIALHRRLRGEQFSLRNVFVRSLPEGRFYLYDLWEAGSESNSLVEQCAVAVVMPGKNLPRFTISPRLELSGTLGGLAVRLTDWMAKQFGPEIVTGQAGFHSHYLLTGRTKPPSGQPSPPICWTTWAGRPPWASRLAGTCSPWRPWI